MKCAGWWGKWCLKCAIRPAAKTYRDRRGGTYLAGQLKIARSELTKEAMAKVIHALSGHD